MHTTEQLAQKALALRPQDLAQTTREAARRCILDLLGACMAGRRTTSARALHRAALKTFGPGTTTVWFSPDRLNPAAAAMVNAAAASALDLDDGHRGAAGHPGAAIIPAVFAVAADLPVPPMQVLAAIAVGYEVGCRIAAARDLDRLPTLSTGRWTPYGVAAATGYLRNVTVPVLAQSLAIAGAQVPDLAAAGYSQVMGNHVKEGIPWSVLLGINAVTLAQEGFTGPLDLLDHPDWFDAQRIIDATPFGRAIEAVYFKPYSSCRWSHAALDGLLAILAEGCLDPAAIAGITIQTFERALRLNNYPDPDGIEGAQYSIPFCLGLAAFHGAGALLPLREASLHDPRAVALARRVTLAVDPELDGRFPVQTAARIIVQTGGQRIEKTVLTPHGDPANPLSPPELEAKFLRLASRFSPPGLPQQILAALTRFEADGFRKMLSLLNTVRTD